MLHRYNKDTKEYIGSMSKKFDPLESELRGRKIEVIPPFCTAIPLPTKIEKDKALVFNEKDQVWEQVEDHRGRIVFDTVTGKPVRIRKLGKCPEGYSFEKICSTKELKDKKKEEITASYFIAYSTEIKVKELKVKVSDDARIAQRLGIAETFNSMPFDQEDGETVFVNKETLELALKTLYVRGMLLATRKQELLNKLKRLKNKESISNFRVDYNVDKETKKLVALTDEEINKYFAGE